MSSLDCMVGITDIHPLFHDSYNALQDTLGISSLTLLDGYPSILLVHNVISTQCPTLVTRQKEHLSLFLYRAQNLQSLISFSKYNLKLAIFLIQFTKHDAIDIADPSSMQDACLA